mgnify:CR=1 FL=1
MAKMESIDPEFVERYQIIFQKDPNSRVFALLTEAYRKMGMLDKARIVGESGTSKHPDFASGHVALGRVYLDLGDPEKACEHFRLATALASENILAHQLLAQSYLKLRQPKDALKAFKMVLLISPTDISAQRAIKKLESLTADEFSQDLFNDVKPGREKNNGKTSHLAPPTYRTLERMLSLADAYAARNDIDKAILTLKECEDVLGSHPEVTHRLRTFKDFGGGLAIISESSEPLKPISRRDTAVQIKKETLEKLLVKVRTRRINVK